MKIAARYLWGKTEKGYGWLPWHPPQLAIEREGQSGFWNVYDADGSLLCRCVDYRSAQRVVGRLRRAELARFNPNSYEDFAFLEETANGLTLHAYAPEPT